MSCHDLHQMFVALEYMKLLFIPPVFRKHEENVWKRNDSEMF